MKLLMLLLVTCWGSYLTWANCASPTGVAGQITWTSNSIQFCDGSTWQSTDHGASTVSCTNAAGTFTYGNQSTGSTTTTYQFCGVDAKWHTMKGSTLFGGNTKAGLIYYSGVTVGFGDGTTAWNTSSATVCNNQIVVAGTGNWTVPTHFGNPSIIYVVGAGGAGGAGDGTNGGGGGGGGSFSKGINPTLTTTTVRYNVGVGGAPSATNGANGGDTWICSNNAAGTCASIGGTSVVAGATGGAGGAYGGAGGVGGTTTNNVGSLKNAGGSGDTGVGVPGAKGAGGGGAAGPNGIGNSATGSTGASADAGTVLAGANGTEWGGSPALGSGGGANGPNKSSTGNNGGNYGGGASGGGGQTAGKQGGTGGGGAIYLQWTSTLSGNCN